MKTITFTKTGSDWSLYMGGGVRKRKIGVLFTRFKKKLPSFLKVNGKITVRVKYKGSNDNENVNETIVSGDKKYLIFATCCFLEDYLSKKTQIAVYKKEVGNNKKIAVWFD